MGNPPRSGSTRATRTRLITGSASRAVAALVEAALSLPFRDATVARFPDGEVMVRLEESVRGENVILFVATAPPVNDNLVELMALADLARRAGAARVVALIPYFGYARSDRRDGQFAPIMASVVAETLETLGVDHVITVDAHTPALEGYFRIPVENVSAVDVLAAAVGQRLGTDRGRMVVVAPDVGAVRFATRYAKYLNLPVAVCHKRRGDGGEVSVSGLTGDVAGHGCIIVDDMISTGGTIVESIRAVREAGAAPSPSVVATHAVLVPGALRRLADAGVQDLFVTDSIGPRAAHAGALRPRVVSIAPLLAAALRRFIEDEETGWS
jgi:ribose-phosphate pyrophosphokinase